MIKRTTERQKQESDACAESMGNFLDTPPLIDEVARIAGPFAAVVVDASGRAEVVDRFNPSEPFDPVGSLAARVAQPEPMP